MPEVFATRPENPSTDDRWIMPGSDLCPPIKNDWALYMDWEHDDPADLRTAAAIIMKEWAGITSLDGRIFSGREQRAMDPREYYKLAVGAFKAGSLTSLFSPEWMEFHEAEGRGDKAAMRALAAKNIRGEGVAAAVGAAADKHVHNSTAAELEEMRRSLGAVRDAMTPDDLETLDHPYRLGMGYVQGVTDLYKKYHGTIEDERRLDAYRKQLADENQWAVIESIKGHVTENARNVLEMALESADDPTNRTVMEVFGKLSTPEMRSIAGALQALHYDRDPNFKALCADAGRAFMNTLESVTAGAVRGATDLLQRTWMDGAEYRDMVDRRVLLEDANRERMADWGIVGNAVIGAASTIPYMAAAAVPYVGMADMMLTARDEFQSQAARNGVDVSSPDFILGSSAFAIAYAYVEKIQWEKAFGGIANLSRRQMYCDVFHSVRAALGVAGAFAGTVLTESGEEGIQAALEEAATHWGQGTTLADEVKAFTEDFVGSLGTMAIIGAFGGAKQGLAYRHGALGFDVADALAAQSRILELDRHMAGHPGEVGLLADYGRTYGRMVEDWINAGTDVERRQASLMRWGLTKEQATAIHGALQNIWTSIEGSDASAERKAEQKSALVGGGHVLTPGEMIARIQNGGYLGKVEQLADGSQAVNMDIAGTTLRMVVQPKREASRIDENDSALFESIVNELNSRNILDADGAKFTVERWTNLTPEQRRDIIETNELYNQGYALFYDMEGNRLDGRVLDAITGNVHMTDVALPQTAFHETMHGVLRLLTNMARGEKAGDGAWKVEPDPAAAALVGELAEIFPALSEREAVNEEALANAFQAYLTDRVGAVEHTGLLDRLGRFLARLFGYGGHTYEIGNARTAHQRLFNTAITGHIAQAVQEAAGEAAAAGRAEVRTEAEPGAQAEPGAEGEPPDAPTPTAAGGAEAVLRLMEADYPELAPLAAMFRNGDPLVHEQMASLVKATGGRLDTDLVWAAGYRWNGVQERWEHDERLERPVDERDRPQQPYMGADGELQEAEARVGAEGLGAEAARPQVASRLPSPEFAMDGTIVDALPAHLREDGRAIVAERGGTAAWMVEADGTPTELNEREWLRREAERRHGEQRYSIGSLYTGSAADYANRRADGSIENGPSLQHIGSGEGSQVYGWGLYGSTVRGVAEVYANPSGKISEVLVNGERHKAVGVYEKVASMLKHGDAKQYIKDTLEAVEEMQRALDESGKSSVMYGVRRIDQKYIDRIKAEIEEARRIIDSGATLAKPGNLYEQTFFTNRATPEETERHLLKWYEPVSDEQLEWIDAQLAKEKIAYFWFRDFFRKPTGEKVYEGIQKLFREKGYRETPKLASEFFARAGIDGIKYPVDSYGKTVKDGDKAGWNYVSFRDDNIRVDHKWVDGVQRYSVGSGAPSPEAVAEAQRQYDDVVARFTKPDGTRKPGWMRAPNGQPTRLDERAWVMVRTENFKRWFGDWEGAKLLGMAERAWADKDHKETFRFAPSEALAKRLEELVGHPVSEVGITADAIRHIKDHHGNAQTEALRGQMAMTAEDVLLIPYILDNFDDAVRVPASDMKHGEKAVEIRKQINGLAIVATTEQGKDKQFVVSGWKRVSAASMLRNASPKLNVRSAADIENVQRDIAEIKRKARDASKVVDENGEPLVVWHGSRWNPLEEKPGDAVFGKSSTPSQGSYLKDRQGFFFANKEVAEGYGVNDPMAFFINAREPYTVDVRDELRELDYDIETEREEAEAAGYPIGRWLGEGDEEFEANDSATAYLDDNMSEIMARSDENRADAVLVKGADGSFVAVVFDPTQIKSATDNVGTFDGSHPDIRYQIAGAAGAGRLGIRGLGDAEAMERSGATREDIWRETGWWRGADGKWRVEVPDITVDMATLGKDAHMNDDRYFVRKRPLARIVGEDSPLFALYPGLRRIKVQTPHGDSMGELWGSYNGETLIQLNTGALEYEPDAVRSVLAHEIQHAIQAFEGLAQGGNAGQFKPVDVAKMRRKAQAERKRGNVAEADRLETEADELEENALDGMVVVDNQGYMDEFEAYQSLAGEVEARNVEKRLKMTPEDRAATPPWETEDVEEGRQIVRFSVQAFADGTQYVHVDTDQDLFRGVKEKYFPKIARKIILRRFRGKVIGAEPPRNAYVKTETAGEFAYPAKPLPPEENTAKMRSAGELGNLLAVGEYAGHKPDDGTHPEATGGWDYYSTIFEVGGKFFSGKVNLLINNRGRVFHDVTDIKENSQGLKDQHGEPRVLFPASGALSPYVKRALADNNSADNATTDTQPQTAGEVNGENGRRGSVAGTDPGWWDVAGQAEAAAREGRELARHGLSFGGPAFSHRSYVEAFAARDRALGFKRTDEDYKRLIDAFGLTGKMTVADAKAAGEALQAEMHGAAATVAELAKQAEKKNFRKTVDRLFTGAAGYGIEVGANARQAWAEYVSRMRRLARGRNTKNMAADAGLVFWEMLLAAEPEGFEAQEKGKPQGGGKATDADDEEAALTAALIDGREGDLGYTADTAKARLAELLEAKKGDVAARNARLKARLEEWRKQEAARLAELQARQEAEAARQAEAGEKDGAADGEGKGKGNRPQESEEEEAVAEMPDFRAFIKALQEDGWDLTNPGEFAAVLRFYVEDWLAEKNGIAPGDVMKDPVSAAEYRATVQEILRDSCNQLLDPNDGAAVRIAERMLGEIPGDASAAEIEARSRSIISFIKRNAIRQSRKKLVAAIIEDINKLAIQGRMFDETEKDIGRKITGEREPYARYVARILLWGDKRIAAEMQRLNDIISGRLDAYRAARAEDAALEDLQRTDREIHRATERLAALQLWGGLRKKSPAEIALAGQQIHQWLETERDAHEKRWTEWKGRNDAMAATLEKAFTADRRDYTPDDPGFVGMAAEELTTNFRMRLERLAAGSGAEGRRAIDQVMMLIYAGSERLGALKAARRQRTDAMLERCVEGTGMKVGDFLKSLDEPIPEALNRELVTEEQPVRMTWGQALQLLGELEQTASYSMNIAENGRTGHRDLILEALAGKPQMLRLLEEMRRIYEEDRTALSDEFFAVTGNPILSPDPLYLPARMFTGARDSLETTVRAWNPFGPAFTPRISNKRDFDLSASIMDVYNARMKETATALAFGMRGMELRSILARKSVQEAIARTHGKYALRKMIAQLTDIVSDGYKGDGGQMEWHRRAIRALGDITTYSALSWNAVTMLKQMTSIPAWTALLDGGYGEIFRHITNFDAEAARELCRSPGFVARYGATGFGKMFRQELENPQGGNVVARLFKAGMTAVQMGDFVPGILVGTGVYKARKLALLRKGLAEPAAREQAARETWGLIEENQQSSRLENTPEILRRGGFIGRQLSKFATSPMMQVAHEIHTLRMWLAEARIEARHGGKESGAVKALMNAQGDDAVRWRKRFVNQLICNHVLMPAAMYAIATIFKACLGGEPPDKEEIYGDLLMQMVAGPWSRIFLIGAIADQTGEWVARMAGGKPNVYSRGDLAATQHLHKALAQVGRIGGDVADLDWASVRDDFVKMASSYNAPIRYAATAIQNAAGYDPAKARRERKREIARREAAAQ